MVVRAGLSDAQKKVRMRSSLPLAHLGLRSFQTIARLYQSATTAQDTAQPAVTCILQCCFMIIAEPGDPARERRPVRWLL